MSGPIHIREGRADDLDAVMRVMEASFDPAFGEAWTAPQCLGMLPMTGVWLSLAEQDGRVVGFTLSRIVMKEAELLLLAVLAENRRAGIGQLLLDHFLSVATNRGAETVHLEVREGNHAVKLYAKAGFIEVGRRKHYYTGRDGQLFDALTLSKSTTV
jgi:ribosomal-protein-alanine N-acetyltransferase